tara:strand:- start:4954 stop:5223 length:270 start_codon:yes stop_codon:yes gene_type:complete
MYRQGVQSNCCSASILDNTDFCSQCKEHSVIMPDAETFQKINNQIDEKITAIMLDVIHDNISDLDADMALEIMNEILQMNADEIKGDEL